ncbi:hypothetical protein H257_16084 [Aphanomyces astaci]|uniref:Transposase Tc1-like domain-containing protein n=1 Tax=Aphanomyces astaci TaxID=112090 RepID=W4FM05_APHAT|nr:hypothetical protein H257_16084 [Aphanomyces astaci]ETV67723.1 hypothetical protein H257_16084 [Aphanomyces astaci]|eukprot:XP_009842716.1 hypothetical protein H257_16084 [Aphanomyces astaci]
MPRSMTKHDLPDDQRLSMYHELLEHKQNDRQAKAQAKELLLKTCRCGIEEEGLSGTSAITTFALLAASSGIPSTTLWRLLQSKSYGVGRLKPMVTDKHKADRVNFIRSFVRESPRAPIRWDDMTNRIHIDENRACPQVLLERHINKVMFLTAVAPPRFDYVRKTMWDGKLGMWPFVSVEPARCKSKNRDRGTLVTTPLTVTKKV